MTKKRKSQTKKQLKREEKVKEEEILEELPPEEKVEITEEAVQEALEKSEAPTPRAEVEEVKPNVQQQKRQILAEKKENLKAKKKEELSKLNQELKDLQLKENRDRIKAIVCQECGENLKLTPDDWLENILNEKQVTCPNCHMINNVRIVLDGQKDLVDAEISVRRVEYAYIKKSVGSMSDELIVKRIEDEARRVDKQTNKQVPIIKALIKHNMVQERRIKELEKKLFEV